MRALLDLARADAGVEPVLPDLPRDVQAIVRHSEHASYLFLLNHGSHAATVALPRPAVDLLGSADLVDAVTLAPRGVAVLRS